MSKVKLFDAVGRIWERDCSAVQVYESTKWEVIDAECETICVCDTEAAAQAVADAMNDWIRAVEFIE